MDYARPEILAEPEWLAAREGRPDTVVIDCGHPGAYARAHIPGALPVGIQNFIKEPEEGKPFGVHVLGADAFAAAMGGLGVSADTTVVCYDDDDGRVSTRLWWVLRYYGHHNARVLNGGWHRWLTEGRPATWEAATPTPATFTASPDPSIITLVDDLKAACETDGTQILDTRSIEEFEGRNSRGNARSGRVPRSLHLEWNRFVRADATRTFLPADELQALVDGAGFTRDEPIITYCQGGIRAAHAAFVLTLLGYDDVRVYDASMGEWANRDDTPLVT